MWYLKSAFDTYEKLQDAIQNRLSEVQSAILSPVDMMKRFLGASASSPQRAADESEVETLRKRVAELEAHLQKPERKPRRPNKKR
jgi:hypothetical protein